MAKVEIRDAVATMGSILNDVKLGQRDAVHVACIAVTADRTLRPNQDVGVTEKLATTFKNPIGKVDPFLKTDVLPGEKFWLYLYPRTITGLNHHWSHPAFKDMPSIAPSVAVEDEKKLNAVKWLNAWLRDRRLEHWDYTGPMINSQLDRYDGEICFPYDIDCDREFSNEFWDNVEIALGRKIVNRPEYFRCAC